MRSTTEVSAILVSFHHGHVIGEAVQSLERIGAGLRDVVVVDNGGDLQQLDMGCGTKVITPGENLGFAGAVNLAASDVRGDLLLLLSPDAEVLEWRESEIKAQLTGKVAAVGAYTFGGDGHPAVSWGEFPGALRLLRRTFGLCRRQDRRVLDSLARGDQVVVPWVLGAAVLLNRRCFDEVGGLDVRYRTCGEDQDFGARLRQAGLTTVVSPAWRVRHQPRDPESIRSDIRANNRRFVADYGTGFDRIVWGFWDSFSRRTTVAKDQSR